MPNPAREPSVALAHHWLMSMRGGEKTVAELAGLFPGAPIYTLLARPSQLDERLRSRELRCSWLQRLGAIPDLQRYALPLLAGAARRLDASAYDVVICSDAAVIKAIRTRPDALKLCYCHTPMRSVWDLYSEYYAGSGLAGRLGLRLFARHVREADQAAAETVDAFVANSHCVADRIRRSYHRSSVLIWPPVETEWPPGRPAAPPEDFYLVVGELLAYKRPDLAIDACRQLGRPLVVIGTGPLLRAMRRRAGHSVRVLGWQPDEVVRDHLRRCRALLFCGQEDFGLVPVQAQAAGRPVIAYAAGGALDSVMPGRSGVFFHEQTVTAVVEAIRRFEAEPPAWSPEQIREHARQFSVANFRRRFSRFFVWCLEHRRAGGPAAVREAMNHIEPEAFLSADALATK